MGRAGLVVGLLAAVLLPGCSSGQEEPPSLREAVLDFVAVSQRADGGSYRAPAGRERQGLTDAVLALADGEDERARALLAEHDFRTAPVRGGTLVLPQRSTDERGLGLYAVLRHGRDIAVEIPHPRADLRTEHLGAALAEAVGARHVLVAGARRDKADGAADVAHEERSVFAAVHEALAVRGVPAVQVHGFAADSAPTQDVIVSPGAAELTPLVREIADRTEEAGLRTCRAWVEECAHLEGRRNAQGAASERNGTPFVHLEVSSRVREDEGRTAQLLDAVADAVRATVARPPAP